MIQMAKGTDGARPGILPIPAFNSASFSESDFFLFFYYQPACELPGSQGGKCPLTSSEFSSPLLQRQGKISLHFLSLNFKCLQRESDCPYFDSGSLNSSLWPRGWGQVVRTGRYHYDQMTAWTEHEDELGEAG